MFASTDFTLFSISAGQAPLPAGARALFRLLLKLPTGCRA